MKTNNNFIHLICERNEKLSNLVDELIFNQKTFLDIVVNDDIEYKNRINDIKSLLKERILFDNIVIEELKETTKIVLNNGSTIEFIKCKGKEDKTRDLLYIHTGIPFRLFEKYKETTIGEIYIDFATEKKEKK